MVTMQVNFLDVNDESERDPYNSAVAEVLNEIYISKGSQLAQLAEAVGVARMSVRRYLEGERPIKVVVLRKFAKALNVSIDEVLTEADRRLEQG